MTDGITLTTRFDRAAFLEAATVAANPEPHSSTLGATLKGMVLAAVIGAVTMVALRLGLGINPDGSHFIALGLGAGIMMVVWWVTARQVHAKIVKLAEQSASKGDPLTMTFDLSGIRIDGQTFHETLQWSAVNQIITGKHATVLQIGANGLPVPHSALPAGHTPETFCKQLRNWSEYD